ncbi:RimJ/RimL family protein N-acetyltransferase [Sedimentibacter acidaminivorans]|uniref:RimJ/RimL family protein N-acetyltransferase n=1 Tax=Sedimentibacter acidaminivorans TaxID=913099 RepID=A0ABS4GFR3_9FIRM|nr:GNAT family N-acetyltransferase [Sedimentibacter acidaminivorans]MBP1926521.1 RimJ/RimL family protein N-acetyltransferase [Sedimentibacter acidaminivorans]
MELYRKDYILKDGQKLTVRIPEVGDAKELINQMQVVDKETKFLAREPGEFDFTLEQESEFIRNNMNDENSHFLLGEINDRIIANCSVGLIQNKKRYLHRAGMGIAVLKDYWNKGIGKIMMQECINWCKEKGVEQLELEVVTQNSRAISMYRSFGFEIYGTKKHALKYENGTYADEYFMCLFWTDIKTE